MNYATDKYPSLELRLLLGRVRSEVLKVLERVDYRYEKVKPETRKALFSGFGKWFPQWKKKEFRDKRLAVVMAMLGSPIASFNDLPESVAHVLCEVMNDPSSYLTRKLSSELQEVVTSPAYGLAWTIPAADAEVLAVPSVR